MFKPKIRVCVFLLLAHCTPAPENDGLSAPPGESEVGTTGDGGPHRNAAPVPGIAAPPKPPAGLSEWADAAPQKPSVDSAGQPPSDGGTIPGTPPGIDGGTQPTASPMAFLDKTVPVLWITVGKDIPRGTKTSAKMKVIEDHDGSLVGIEARPASLQTPIGIEIRGSSSANKYLQKPYGIELRDDAGMNRAAALLGLSKESDFVLHSCFSDKSCMRNALIYSIGAEMSAARGKWWSPRFRYVEVYIDGKYAGLYLLCEKIKQDKQRVDIPTPDDNADITGGYLISAEGPGKVIQPPGSEWIDKGTGLHFYYQFPKYDQITGNQRTYIQGALTKLQAQIDSNTYRDKADLPTWVDFFLIQELTLNTDGFYKSWFFSKQPDAAGGKWAMGPLWDFDIALGNANYNTNLCWNTSFRSGGAGSFGKVWKDQAFTGALNCRWNELRQNGGPLDAARIDARLAQFMKHIEKAKKRDQDRWKNIGAYVWPNNYIGASHADEVKYLTYWMHKRLAWLDKNMVGACPGKPAPPTVMPTPLPPSVMDGPRPNMPSGIAEPYMNPESGPKAGVKYSCPAP